MKNTHIKTALRLASAMMPLCVVLGHGQAMAQADTNASADSNQRPVSTGLEEIVVTAQRRAENLQDVPIAIASFSNEALENMGIKSVNELSVATPGLTMTQQRNGISPFLRGVGTIGSTVAEEGNVPVYLDGILVPHLTGAAFSFPSVERVEVLKGPQGTLFGRNSMGGLINVITRDPSHETSGNVSVGYANYNTITASAYATSGITDNAAIDITAYTDQQGKGWGRNLNYSLGGPLQGTREDSYYRRDTLIRSKLLLTPTEKLRITLAGDYNVQKNTIGIERAIKRGSTTLLGVTKQGGFWDTQIVPPTNPHVRTWSASGRVEYEFDFAKFASTTSFRNLNERFTYDQDGEPRKLISAPEVQKQDVWQQEFLLTNSTDNFDWTVGLYYFYSDTFYDSDITSEVNARANLRVTTTQLTNSYAAFAQATYRFGTGTSITAGFRYTKDKRELDGLMVTLPGHPSGAGVIMVDRDPDVDPTATLKANRPTWRLSVDQKLGDNALVYASYNRGFKSGLFSQTGTAITQPPVKPEKLDAYEVGFKSELADRTVRFNAAAFYYDYTNTQLSRTVTGAVINFNAPGSEIYGIDGELTFAPRLETGSLQLTANASYLHGRYKDFPNAPFSEPLPGGGNTTVSRNARGNVTVRTPSFSGSFAASYQIPTASGEFGISGVYYYTSKFYWEVDNRLAEPSYSIVNTELSWIPNNSAWRFSVFGRNITNSKYSVYTTGGNNGDLYAPAAPRTYGVAAKLTF